MSEYEDSSVSKISSYGTKRKEIKVKPGSLPWEEESMTFGRDKGAVLLKLQRENAELRKKLKEFNGNINQIIEKFKLNKPKKEVLENRPEDSLDSMRKKLSYYE
jgi:hypothetical protein